jgi:hypothetical protein
MNEADWDSCTDPKQMLNFLKDTASDRKLRLFICACCRQVWHRLINTDSRHTVEVVEDYVDGQATAEHLAAAKAAAEAAYRAVAERPNRPRFRDPEYEAAAAAWRAAEEDLWVAVIKFRLHLSPLAYDDDALMWGSDRGRAAQVRAFRCIMGNPFRPVSLSFGVLSWNNSLVVRLAQAAYDERLLPLGQLGPERLSVLGDALEEAGADAELVAHLRQPGAVHVRGCHVVDLVRGQE